MFSDVISVYSVVLWYQMKISSYLSVSLNTKNMFCIPLLEFFFVILFD